jgi:hypothetical protein
MEESKQEQAWVDRNQRDLFSEDLEPKEDE